MRANGYRGTMHLGCIAAAWAAAALGGCSERSGAPAPAGTAGRASGEEPVVNLYFWSDYLAPDTLSAFEKKTGIKVHLSYFDSYETLEAKLSTGNSGFDVVLPGTGTFAREIKSGAYQVLDKAQLPNSTHLDPELMAKVAASDPGNVHGVIYTWSTYGVGYNRKLITERLPGAPLTSWRLVLDPTWAAKAAFCGINFIDDPAAVVQLVLRYLGKDPGTAGAAELAAVEKVLLDIRPYVRTIDTSGEIAALANGDICVTLGYSGDIVQANRRAKESGNGIVLAYSLPDEGSMVGFDLLAIPRDAPHPKNAHKLIDYLLEARVAAEITNFIGYANANRDATPLLAADIAANTAIYPTPAERERLVPEREVTPEQSRAITRIWQRFKTGQ